MTVEARGNQSLCFGTNLVQTCLTVFEGSRVEAESPQAMGLAGPEVAGQEDVAGLICMEEELQWVPVVQVELEQGILVAVGEAVPVLAGKEVVVRRGQGRDHQVEERLLEGEEDVAQNLDRQEDSTSVERQDLASELDPSTGSLLSGQEEPIWIPGTESVRLEGVSEPVPEENRMARFRCSVLFPSDLA